MPSYEEVTHRAGSRTRFSRSVGTKTRCYRAGRLMLLGCYSYLTNYGDVRHGVEFRCVAHGRLLDAGAGPPTVSHGRGRLQWPVLYSPPPQRNCQAIPPVVKLLPIRANTPGLA
jgi:hypothetical protein